MFVAYTIPITRAIMPSIERALNKIMLKDFDKYVELKQGKKQ